MTKDLICELMDRFFAPVAKLQTTPNKIHVTFTISAVFFHRQFPTLFAKRFPTKNYHRDSSTPWCFNSKLTVFFDADTPKRHEKKKTNTKKIAPGEEASAEIEENQAKSCDHLILIGEGNLHQLSSWSQLRLWNHSTPNNYDRWWQLKHFWNFHPEPWGNDPIWRAYFSNGLVQPPTRVVS